MLCIVIFFWFNGTFLSTMNSWALPTDGLWVFFVAFVGVNGLVEAIVNCLAAGTVSKIVSKAIRL